MAGVKGKSGGHNRKSIEQHRLAGTFRPSHHARWLPTGTPTGMPIAVTSGVEPAGDLPVVARQVWEELGPHARANGTLVPATALAFRLLCANVALERTLAADPKTCGGVNHRGMLHRVDVELAAFCLAPVGDPMAQQPGERPNPLAKFMNRSRWDGLK